MKQSGIYEIKSKIDNRKYVGSSKNLYNRKHSHFYMLKSGKHKNPKLQNFYNKYGKNSLEFSIIEYCEESILLEREQFYLDTKEFTFNICEIAGRRTGYKVSEESKRKMSIAAKGRTFSKETRKKIGLAHKGRVPKSVESFKKKVIQKNKDLEVIKVWNSMRECDKYGFNSAHISSCCNKKRKTHKGFIWEFYVE